MIKKSKITHDEQNMKYINSFLMQLFSKDALFLQTV